MFLQVVRIVRCAAFLIALSSCHRSRHTYTEGEVNAFVRPGVPREAIVARFGQPIAEDKSADGYTIIYFHMPGPNPPVEERWVFSGFQVWLKDGKTVKWAPEHRDIRVGH